MITEEEYKQALTIVNEYRKSLGKPSMVDQPRSVCDRCGNSVFTHIPPDSDEIKGLHGTKHYYKCDLCGKKYWSFFYNMETENVKEKENDNRI